MLRCAAYEFWTITRENFGANRPNRPAPWAPLKASTIKTYKRKYYGANLDIPTLLRSGRLMNSIRFEVSVNQFATVWQDASQAQYGGVHQFGGRKTPARPFFPVVSNTLTPYAENRILAKLKECVARFLH